MQVMLQKSLARADQTNLERLMLLGAKWEDLAELLQGNEGKDKVADRLRTVYGFRAGDASSVASMLARIASRERVDGNLFVDRWPTLPHRSRLCSQSFSPIVHRRKLLSHIRADDA